MLRWIIIIVFLSLVFIDSNANGQRTIVELEIAASAYDPIETQRRWMEVLSEVGIDRVRSKTANTQTVSIKEFPGKISTRIKISGAIDNGKLILPGKSFSIREKNKIADYIKELRKDGVEFALADKKAFGLTSKQLVDVNQLLSTKVSTQTTDQNYLSVVDSIEKAISKKIYLDPTAKRIAGQQKNVKDELNGLSAGTMLAAISRPYGLVLVPQRAGSKITLNIVDYRKAKEHWPIGWPATYEVKKQIPNLYNKNPIEIRNFPLNLALSAIQSKCQIPMIFDYNSMAEAEINLTKTQINFVKERSTYVYALGKILNQTKPRMDYEIRVDECGQPFFWLSTANPVK